MNDPFGDALAGAAGLRDPETEAATLIEIRQPVRRPDIGIAVGRVGDRPVDHPLHATLAQDRHPLDRVVDVLLQPLQVVRPQLVGEIVGNAVEPMRRRLPLIGSEQQSRPLLSQIPADIGIAQQRQLLLARFQFADRLRHQILMRHGDDRHVLPDHGHDLAGPIAGGVDHDLAGDVALVGDHAPFARGRALQPGHLGEALDAAAEITRALGEGLGQLARIDVAVERIPQRADEIMRLQKRILRLRLRRRQQRELQPLRMRHGRNMLVFVQARIVVRQPDRAGDVVVDGIVDELAEFGVEPGRMALELDHVPTGREVRRIARRVPGRA
jgi:hypothetical protein